MSQDHEGALCASLGHYVGTITVVYCPHLQAWSLYARAGDDSDDTWWRMDSLTFGPFDTDDDVQRRARSELDRLLRADRAGWAAHRGPEGRRGIPTTED